MRQKKDCELTELVHVFFFFSCQALRTFNNFSCLALAKPDQSKPSGAWSSLVLLTLAQCLLSCCHLDSDLFCVSQIYDRMSVLLSWYTQQCSHSRVLIWLCPEQPGWPSPVGSCHGLEIATVVPHWISWNNSAEPEQAHIYQVPLNCVVFAADNLRSHSYRLVLVAPGSISSCSSPLITTMTISAGPKTSLSKMWKGEGVLDCVVGPNSSALPAGRHLSWSHHGWSGFPCPLTLGLAM